jgi:hypothetical protein
MTDQQLYLAIGIPGALFALNFLAVLAGFFWQAKRFDDLAARFESRFTSMEKVMDAKFEAQTQGLLRVEGVLDARLKHLEDREK